MPTATGGKKRRQKGSGADVRKFPDDPDIQVDLADSFRQEVRTRKLSRMAKGVQSPRRGKLHPSSLSRYLQGKLAPTMTVARRLAAAFNKPLGEVVAGISARHRRRTEEWTRRLLYAKPFRERTYAFIEQFSNVLGYCHFGLPTDPEHWGHLLLGPNPWLPRHVALA
jgi:transcriptional regulator with XRE-family HTH domain